MKNLTNLPPSINQSDLTLKAFDSFYSPPIEIDSTVLAAMKGFFVNNEFQEVAAEQIASTIIQQAKTDGYNPMEILDTLKKIDKIELSGLVAEILNYNRLKTSSLGYAQPFTTNPEVARNILA
ncbi:MAG: hypothetical protein EBU90_12015 [Proteobacteria bacterium]|nr:hypothetical protein [Pseudomonadota bacterium]NBP14827.1 hypothetical protein [bacterium]